MKTVLIMAAGGSGRRMKTDINKILLPLAGKTVIRRSLEAFSGLVDEVVLSVRPEDRNAIQNELELSGISCPFHLVPGGATRQESVLNGLKSFPWSSDDIVLVHDAARCMVDQNTIMRVIDSSRRFGSGIPAVPAVSTFKLCNTAGIITGSVPRSSLFEIQTPQGFFGSELLRVSLKALESGFEATDDSSIMEWAGMKVRTVAGSAGNIKLTTMEDYMSAERMMSPASSAFRIGTGYDVHRIVDNRKLVLCGVEIPWEFGLLGHSDADVALHALMDARLGAASLGDIGRHFPDSDPQYKGISSVILLKKTAEILQRSGYALVNADITIIAQKPKLLPYISAMRESVSDALSCDPDRISIKATTTEQLGFEGRMEGISAQAVCLIIKT